MGQLVKVATELGKFTKTDTRQHQMLALVHRNLCDRGSLGSNMYNTGRRRLTWINIEEQVLQFFEDNPNTTTQLLLSSLRSVSQQCGRYCAREMSLFTICKGCNHCSLTIIGRVWGLHNGSCRKVSCNPNFLAYVFFTDEASFSRKG
ncbi:hypothetical protein TNCT_73751 [Trichonephila clavata]|uniref:Uncharacterized protein n=1 Tax=Trichonephila clavata TaxID=2740835 RepID=A0A8X6HJJ5_TRICU|nr:hypothetical protein TNCT_73751 [Trichonephila clavata]